MKKLMLIFLVISTTLLAQNKVIVTVSDSLNDSFLIGANVFVKSIQVGGVTDKEGKAVLKNIPKGNYLLTVSYVGYNSKKLLVKFPDKNGKKTIKVYLLPKDVKSDQVVITSTRTNGVEADSPVRVEVLGLDEVNEEIGIRPGNISKLLGETSGVIVQQLSPISGTVSFRLQGLPGQYTQLCKDGMPVNSDFSSGLTLLQIPPLDLEQVEVVKGPSSVFYGNGAVAGFVNLVTRKPVKGGGLELVLNRTSKKGTDLSSFYSDKFNNLGVTFLTSFSNQSAADVAGNGYTDIPEFTQFTIAPKLFWDIDENSNLEVGINVFYENRLGGSMYAVHNGSDSLHPSLERNKSNRYGATVKYKREIGNRTELNFRSNYSYYNRNWFLSRSIYLSDGYFAGKNIDSFSELSLLTQLNNHTIVSGINYSLNYFKETDDYSYDNTMYNYDYSIGGIFLQDDWKISNKIIVQPAIRIDFMKDYSPIYLPHFSVMYKFTDNFSSRISLGSGYKMPTIFELNLDSKDIVWHYVHKPNYLRFPPVRETGNGANLDFNYKLVIDEFVMKINQSFYYTRIQNGLISGLMPDVDFGPVIFYNGATLISKGFDTNLYFAFDEFEVFADYSYVDVNKTVDNNTFPLALTPKNKLNLTFTYEEEGSWRTGFEAFYTDKQSVPIGLNYFTDSKPYWIYGIMFEKFFNNSSVIINVENILDNRQSKYEKLVSGTDEYPSFAQIYMPTEGIVANLAVRIKIK